MSPKSTYRQPSRAQSLRSEAVGDECNSRTAHMGRTSCAVRGSLRSARRSAPLSWCGCETHVDQGKCVRPTWAERWAAREVWARGGDAPPRRFPRGWAGRHVVVRAYRAETRCNRWGFVQWTYRCDDLSKRAGEASSMGRAHVKCA